MKLSIIIPTIYRKIELEELLDSIQNYVKDISFEVIIVDQNLKGFLDEVIDKFINSINISHHLVTFKGISLAKNYGVKVAKGEYLTFPDDDCKIFPDTYLKALQLIFTKKADIVFGKCIDDNGIESVIQFKEAPYYLNKNNMQGGFVEATGVISKKIFHQNFYFDEVMGAGQFFGAEEGYDWLYRILTQSNFTCYYSNEIKFYHPQVLLDKGLSLSLNRVFTYSCGKAYLYKKHRFYIKLINRLMMVLFSIPFFIIFERKKAKYYFTELLGLLSGYILS